jgi:hypothetical protein
MKHLPDGRHILKRQTKTWQIQNGHMLNEHVVWIRGHLPLGAVREGALLGAPTKKCQQFFNNGDEQVQACQLRAPGLVYSLAIPCFFAITSISSQIWDRWREVRAHYEFKDVKYSFRFFEFLAELASKGPHLSYKIWFQVQWIQYRVNERCSDSSSSSRTENSYTRNSA